MIKLNYCEHVKLKMDQEAITAYLGNWHLFWVSTMRWWHTAKLCECTGRTSHYWFLVYLFLLHSATPVIRLQLISINTIYYFMFLSLTG